jgi:SAM-dependent methyltransferase
MSKDKPELTGIGIDSEDFMNSAIKFFSGNRSSEVISDIKNGYRTRPMSTICIDDITLWRIAPRINWILTKLKNMNHDISILDAGSWTGAFTNAIYEAGYRHIECLDLSINVCKLGRCYFPHLRFINEDIEVYMPKKKYDVVLLCEILEHLIDPFSTIQSIKKNYLNDNGIILITIPDDKYVVDDFKQGRFEHIYPINKEDLQKTTIEEIEEIRFSEDYNFYCTSISK